LLIPNIRFEWNRVSAQGVTS